MDELMATAVAPNRLLTSDTDSALASDVLGTLDVPSGFLAVGHADSAAQPVPEQLGRLLQRVLESVAQGATVTISTMPAELTTVTAASLIGVSRPTLMKMIREGRLPAHKVGSQTRLKASDVMQFIRQRQDAQRAAFDELRDLMD